MTYVAAQKHSTHPGREGVDSAPFALLGYEPRARGDSKSIALQVGYENAKFFFFERKQMVIMRVLGDGVES